MNRLQSALTLSLTLVLACEGESNQPEPLGPLCDDQGLPRYVVDAQIVASGDATDCRGEALCPHNENTDLTRFGGDIYMVHRTAMSQILGPNSSLHVLRSRDEGESFELVAVIPAPADRDIRDPIFYQVDGELFIKAITRLRGFTPRDQDVDSVSVAFRSSDGASWAQVGPIGPAEWGFWRVTRIGDELFSAAYRDGDTEVDLFRSTDGVSWTQGAQIYGVAVDTPLETELVATPGGRMLAIVRMDGTDEELLGEAGRLRTKLCWADPPFDSFDCPSELTGVRLDGAVHVWHDGRLFVIARKHLAPTQRKRTAIYELTGDFERGPLTAIEWASLPSASDTAYAGVLPLDAQRYLVSWYSGDVAADQPWTTGMLGTTDVWTAVFDTRLLSEAPPTAAECPDPRAEPPVVVGPKDCHDLPVDPSSLCGLPCDQGNDIGVGEYCSPGGSECDDNAGANTCSAALNGSLVFNSYVCTRVCDAATGCGDAASCLCMKLTDGGEICGCVPDRCELPPEVLAP